MDKQEEFEESVRLMNAHQGEVSNDNKLRLYGLYKQATTGDAVGSRPGAFKVRERAKFDAWVACKGMTSEAAMTAYSELSAKLRKA